MFTEAYDIVEQKKVENISADTLSNIDEHALKTWWRLTLCPASIFGFRVKKRLFCIL